jgi:hypothetical protein
LTSANKPRWWQRLIPRYGNYGCPGWSAGEWNNDPALTDWTVPPVDAMDALFRAHDYAYQAGASRIDADRKLVKGLLAVDVRGLYPRLYRLGAIAAFAAHGWWLRLCSKCKPPAVEGAEE